MELLDIKITGQTILQGEIEVSSSKNAILPILAASLLTDNEVVIKKIIRMF